MVVSIINITHQILSSIHFTLVGQFQFQYQMDAFCGGFYEVVPKEDVAVFEPGRAELCMVCNNEWGHDKISTLNMLLCLPLLCFFT